MTAYRLPTRLVKVQPSSASGFGIRKLIGPGGKDWFTNGATAWSTDILSPESVKLCNERHKVQRDYFYVDLFWPRSARIKMEYKGMVKSPGGHTLMMYESLDGKILRAVDEDARPPKFLWLSVTQSRFPMPGLRSDNGGGSYSEDTTDRVIGRLRPSDSARNDIMVDHPDVEKATMMTSPYSVTADHLDEYLYRTGRIQLADVQNQELQYQLKREADDAAQDAARAAEPKWFKLIDDNRPAFDKKLKALSKHAAKLGVRPPEVEIGEEIDIPVYPDGDTNRRPTHYIKGHKVRIVVPDEIKLGSDFEVLAMVKQLEGGVNTVHSFGRDDKNLPSDLWSTTMLCEHCNKVRARKSIFLVEDLATGERMKVGSACIDDYTGHPGMEALVNTAGKMFDGIDELMQDDDIAAGWDMGSSSNNGFLMEDVVSLALVIVEQDGKYISRTNENPPLTFATASVVQTLLMKRIKEPDKVPEPSPVQMTRANEILKWVREDLVPVSEYERNLKAVAALKYVPTKQLGLVCSFIPSYGRAVGIAEATERRKAEAERVMTTTGGDPYRPEEIGKKITFRGHLEFRTSFDTQWGTKHILKFKDEVGRIVTWGTSASPRITLPKMNIMEKAKMVFDLLPRDLPFKYNKYKGNPDLAIADARAGRDLYVFGSGKLSDNSMALIRNADLSDPEQLQNARDAVAYTMDLVQPSLEEVLALLKAKNPSVIATVEDNFTELTNDLTPEQGKTYIVTGTIKEKKIYRDEHQTEIQRATINPDKAISASLDLLSDIADVMADLDGIPLEATMAVEEAFAYLSASSRNHSLVVHIPLPKEIASYFPDAIYNHGHDPHATVCFVTSDPTATITENVVHAVRRACRKIPPFVLSLDVGAGLQDFGDGNNGEKALWFSLNAEPNGLLSYLHRVIRQALEEEGLPCEAHDTFKGHVTWRYVPNATTDAERARIQAAAVARMPANTSWLVRSVMVSTERGERAVILNPKALVPEIVTRGALSAKVK